ncbi:MAG: putative sulfate exporter family transporter [Chlorobi bacterium]|uniref:Sulfate exporter family transporter n=3 Tax=Chryseobacterium TaxID=59732 RepID=A0AAJ1VJ56_9FLAO|nr:MULTISPECIES: putative sulfate exporter family transporter [Flavobacteriales]NPA08045.1 putative sulfate exporter family transporter [Chlorobiota bacterium]QWA38101.1 putative sulfate exporter family transporter [Chryseobacterium sp. ZHDP1]MBF6645676.1 putative sulfate exporter family transporter [Chryseobacterium indologenes]MBU3049846.1 putative sulfate exporter family transporter [Chryseobacterium indologenes]MDN4011331.1 putative sulfate exporter family transporter [Chryseobacterium gam
MEQDTQKPNKLNRFKSLLDRSITTREVIFLLAVVFCLSPLISPPIALLMGLVIAQFIGHPYLHLNHKATHILLQVSVVGLGFGMNVTSAMKAGKEGILFTIVSIIGTLVIGYLMGKFLKIDKKSSYLISAGTAICGGSAIAAVSPVIKAEEKQISVALGTVFILNSIALFIFPIIGHALNLSQTQFGLWSAIAIHDTSSVVGAASKYGTQALEVATTVKLARALWIIPIAFLSTFLFKNKGSKVKIPYFIGLFVLAMIVNTYIPFVQNFSHYLTGIAKAGLTLTLFLIGCGLNRKLLMSVGFRPLIQGVVLWGIISAAALWAVTSFAS